MKTTLISLFAVSLLAVGCAHGHGKHHDHKGHHGHQCSHKAKHWEKMDADKDGSITKKEFDSAHGEKFEDMDADKDGKVTKEEMKAHKKEKMSAKGKDCGCGKEG